MCVFSAKRGARVRRTYVGVCNLKATPFAWYKFHQACVHSCSSYHSSPCQVVGSTPKWDNTALLYGYAIFVLLGLSERLNIANGSDRNRCGGCSFLQLLRHDCNLDPVRREGRTFLGRESYLNTLLQRGYADGHSFSHRISVCPNAPLVYSSYKETGNRKCGRML